MTAVAQMDESTADRLVKVLRLLSSDVLGERAAAAHKANQIVVSLGLDWGDIVRPAPQPAAHESAWEAYGQGCPTSAPSWHSNLDLALRFPHDLTQWERQFLANMRGRTSATAKQRACLTDIASRLRARGRS